MDSKEKSLSENKLRDDAKALKETQYVEEIREMLRRFEVPEEKILDIEKDDNIPKLMEAKELVKKLGGTELYEKKPNGEYKVYAKITAISVLSASVGIMSDLGIGFKATPYFAGVSTWLGVPIASLRRWWDNQSIILREQISIGSAAVQRITLKQLELAELYTDGLKLTKDQIAELAKTPKGINVMMKAAGQALYIAKFLTAQGDAIAQTDRVKTVQDVGAKHGVTILMPIEIVEPVKKHKKQQGKGTDGNDVTDRG